MEELPEVIALDYLLIRAILTPCQICVLIALEVAQAPCDCFSVPCRSYQQDKDFSLPLLRLHPINYFAIYNLHRPVSDVIHPSDPLHLAVCLELLCDTFHLGHLLYQPRE